LRTAVDSFGEANPWSGTFLESTIGYSVNGHSYGVLGLSIGSQIQIGRSVFGVSGGVQGLGPDSIGVRTNWTGTVLARVGYAASDRLLPYIAVGPAVTGVERPGLPTATATGWNVVAGVDYRLNQDWSATASMGYFGFPTIVVGGVGPEVNLSHGELRAGLVFRLPAGWWTK
jgi:opacity protein-like surface antigen